ncbi:MAG: hypothetical protein ACRDAX_03310 [Propionibacteriaceae bacterium]
MVQQEITAASIVIRPTTETDVAAGKETFPKIIVDNWIAGRNRRSFVALHNDEILGHCHAADNIFHPFSRTFLLSTAKTAHNSIIEDALVSAQLAVSTLPLTMKIDQTQSANQELAHRHGGVVVQLCPPWEYTISEPLKQWAQSHIGNAESIDVSHRVSLLELFINHYTAQHKNWAPAAPLPVLREAFAEDFIAENYSGFNLTHSYILRRDSEIVAASLVWASDSPDEVSEITLHSFPYDSPTSRSDSETCLAATVLSLPDQIKVGIDSHITERTETAMAQDLPGKSGGTWLAIVEIPSTSGLQPQALCPNLIPGEAAWVRKIKTL